MVELSAAFVSEAQRLVAEEDAFHRPLLGLSEYTEHAWNALRSIAKNLLGDDESIRAALRDIRQERHDDAR